MAFAGRVVVTGPTTHVVSLGALVEFVYRPGEPVVAYAEEPDGRVRLLTTTGELPIPDVLAALVHSSYFANYLEDELNDFQ